MTDNHAQIRIRRFVEDGEPWYEVSLGRWVWRWAGRRSWHQEYAAGRVADPSYHETLDAAKTAAAAPKLVAKRDYLRRLRGNPPAQ